MTNFKKILPSKFNKKAEFGSIKSELNKYTGVSLPKFERLFILHFKPFSRTINQQYLATQAGMSDTRIIMIRHNTKVNSTLKVKINNTLYDIVSIDSNESFGFDKYDYITIRETKKVGGRNG